MARVCRWQPWQCGAMRAVPQAAGPLRLSAQLRGWPAAGVARQPVRWRRASEQAHITAAPGHCLQGCDTCQPRKAKMRPARKPLGSVLPSPVICIGTGGPSGGSTVPSGDARCNLKNFPIQVRESGNAMGSRRVAWLKHHQFRPVAADGSARQTCALTDTGSFSSCCAPSSRGLPAADSLGRQRCFVGGAASMVVKEGLSFARDCWVLQKRRSSSLVL